MLEVIMKEGVETLRKHVPSVQLEVLVSCESLKRVQLDHVTHHPLWEVVQYMYTEFHHNGLFNSEDMIGCQGYEPLTRMYLSVILLSVFSINSLSPKLYLSS